MRSARSRRFVALWFALAFLGGLPSGIVEWITLAMLGGFAYAIGFMIPLVLAYLIEDQEPPSCGGARRRQRCDLRRDDASAPALIGV